MSLFEWLGESYNPGPVGGVDVGGRIRGERSRAWILVCTAVAVALLALWAYLLLGVWHTGALAATLGTALYLFLGYFVHPSPEMSNVGWLGGLMDHPFRYSDDLNRFLLFLVVVLWPGRFVAESLVDGACLLAAEWRS